MKFIEQIFEKPFSDEDRKEAYMKACRWLATNIIRKDEFRDVTFKIEPDDESEFPTFILRIFVYIEEKKETDMHCKACAQMCKLFYVTDNTNCAKCNMKGYIRRVDKDMLEKKIYYKDKIGRIE